ncbi:MAG: N-6 DNA methylase, partial [candidate division WOR-3 bacterium]
MRSKIKGKLSRIPDAYDSSTYKTERTCCARISEWINRIIEDNHLDFGPAEVETRSKDDRYPDIIIRASPRSNDIACVMEFKPPYFDPFDEEELKEPARKKATHRYAQYFVTSNFQELIWWNTANVNSAKQEHEQIVNRYTLSQIEDLNQIDEFRYSENIKKALAQFILKLYAVYYKKEPEPKQAIDEILIYLLQIKIYRLAKLYREIIENTTCKNPEFSKVLQQWFIEQGWSFAWQAQDFDKAARQAAYLLVNKVLFYNLLQAKRHLELAPLEIPEGLLKGAQLQKILQSFFDEVLKIDYETIYTTDFIDTIAFPDAKEVISEVKELVKILKRYDFSQIGYDVIGRIFERLIPQDERHNLGQYFTNADVVDLILRFCLHHEDDKVLDPACGAGTFLVRAYQHKKLMNMRLEHEKILETLWGVDIAKFPAHLATINLAINDLSVDKNYPNILQEDFFALKVGGEGFDPEKWRKARAKTLGLTEREVIYPRWFDAIVGNPPYTRQEEIPEIGVDKEKLIRDALMMNGTKLAEISKRAGIHAYFFVHGTKFLREGGYFGFIVSNSWLDVEYGKGLQEFFLKNYKIITIIESKVERWFEDADINTCIIILQKCKDKKTRDENLVRFVYLKKPLRNFIPQAQDIWEKQVERLNAIDKLKKTILAHNEFYENEELRIFPKSQKELWDEGFDAEKNKYLGSKWGKYLRAPEIFFKILEKGKDKFVPLKEIAEVRRGYIPWPYDVFRLTKDEIIKYKIPTEYIKETLSGPSESSRIVIDESTELPYYLLIVDEPLSKLKDDNLKKYLKMVSNKVDRAKSNPDGWFCLQKRQASPIIWPRTPYNRHVVFLNKKGVSVIDHIEIAPQRVNAKLICGLLNSSIYILFREVYGRTGLGGGTLKNEVIDLKMFPLPTIKKRTSEEQIIELFEQLAAREPLGVFEEFGANSPNDVFLDKIKPDRRELDKIIMGDILGLTEEEQLEVYRAVVDLVKSRIEKAKSVTQKRKTKEGIDLDMLVKTIMDKIGDETIGKFYKEKVLSKKRLSTCTIPQPVKNVGIKKELFDWKVQFG